MKTLILFLSLLVSPEVMACNKSIDPNKVVLYVSINGPGTELDGAIAGACARGERLITIPPEDYLRSEADYLQRLAVAEAASERATDLLNKCQKECDALKIANDEAYQRYLTLENESRPETPSIQDTAAVVKAELENLRASGAKVSALVLSGHDGAGAIWGRFGDFSKEQVFALATEYPDVLADLPTVLLMGCYTTVADEIDQWKVAFPRLKVLGGFAGSAPLTTRAASGNMIRSLLSRAAKIRASTSRAEVDANIRAVANINDVTASLYVDTSAAPCSGLLNNDSDYRYVSPAFEGGKGLSAYEPTTSAAAEAQCNVAQGSLNRELLYKYFRGEKEPDNTIELRGQYTLLRTYQHCFDNQFAVSPYTADQVLYLRFFTAVKKNFGKFFAQDSTAAYAELEAYAAENANFAQQLQDSKPLTPANIAKMSRAEILDAISQFEGLMMQVPERTAATRYLEALNQHLYNLKCLDLSWHEYSPGARLSAPVCE